MRMTAEIKRQFHYGGLLLFPDEAVCFGMIPKVASLSIRQMLTSAIDEKPVQFKTIRLSKRIAKARTAQRRSKKLAHYVQYLDEQEQEWFSCFFVRHPLSRFVSLFEYCRRHRVVRRQMGFEQFAATFTRRVVEDQGLEYLARRQTDFVCLDPSLVGRFEHLAHDMNVLLGLLGKDPVDEMPQLNRRSGSDWRDYYRGNRIADMVREYYADDFALWDTATKNRLS